MSIHDAKVLLEKAAEKPEMDELFDRAPPLSQEEHVAMLKYLRRERVSWGGGEIENREGEE